MAAHKSHSPTRIFALSQLLRKIWAFKKERFEVGHPVLAFSPIEILEKKFFGWWVCCHPLVSIRYCGTSEEVNF